MDRSFAKLIDKSFQLSPDCNPKCFLFLSRILNNYNISISDIIRLIFY